MTDKLSGAGTKFLSGLHETILEELKVDSATCTDQERRNSRLAMTVASAVMNDVFKSKRPGSIDSLVARDQAVEQAAPEEWIVRHVIGIALKMIHRFEFCCRPFGASQLRKDGAILWYHHEKPLLDIQNQKVPQFDRSELELLVTEYLESPWRCSAFERLFVDALIAMELYQFGDQVLNPFIVPGFLSWLARFLERLSGERRQAVELLALMNDTYLAVGGDGAISATHLKSVLNAGTAKKIIWPPVLFALLDDVERRTGRI